MVLWPAANSAPADQLAQLNILVVNGFRLFAPALATRCQSCAA